MFRYTFTNNNFCIHHLLDSSSSHHDVIYLRTASATAIGDSMCWFLSKYVLVIASSLLLAKSTTACPSLFLFPNLCLPVHSSSPLFPSPTCPFRSASTTILSFFGIFSTVSSRSSQNVSFSSRMHPTCGAYALMTFNITPSSFIFKHIIVSVTLHNSINLSTCSFFNMIPTPFFLFPLPQYHILYPPPMHLALSPFQRVSCTHGMSTPLRSIRSATSLPLPVMVPKFNVATLSLIFLVFFLSSFLFFLLSTAFRLFFASK